MFALTSKDRTFIQAQEPYGLRPAGGTVGVLKRVGESEAKNAMAKNHQHLRLWNDSESWWRADIIIGTKILQCCQILYTV